MRRPLRQTRKPLTILKGETFRDFLQWGTTPKLYATIEDIAEGAPATIVAPGHGIPDGWPIERIVGVQGMTEINTHRLVAGAWQKTPRGEEFSEDEPLRARRIDADTIALDAINAASFSAYTGGGVIEFWSPVDIADFTGLMQIRPSPTSNDVLLELSTTNGRLSLDVARAAIHREIDVIDVDEIDWSEGVCTLEMTAPDGIVTLLEINRPVYVSETDVSR